MTADLVVWLRAQLDEDERGIRTALRTEDYGVSQRDLLEVESQRRILDRYEDCVARLVDDGHSSPQAQLQIGEYEDFILPALALPYADRPGYREGWRP